MAYWPLVLLKFWTLCRGDSLWSDVLYMLQTLQASYASVSNRYYLYRNSKGMISSATLIV